MKIHIVDNLYIRSDELNYIVSELNIKDKDGSEYWVDKTFHRTISQALESICTRKLRKSHATTFEGILKEEQKLNELIAEINKKLTLKGLNNE